MTVAHQRASRDLESGDLGHWGRHKAHRQVRETSTEIDRARETWERHGQPYADQLEAARGQLARQAAELEQAQLERQAMLAKRPDVPDRLAELSRAIAHEEELQRRYRYKHIMQREQARQVGIWPAPDTGRGVDL